MKWKFGKQEKELPFYQKIQLEGGVESHDWGDEGGYTIANEEQMYVQCPASREHVSPFDTCTTCKFFGGHDFTDPEYRSFVQCSFVYKQKKGLL